MGSSFFTLRFAGSPEVGFYELRSEVMTFFVNVKSDLAWHPLWLV